MKKFICIMLVAILTMVNITCGWAKTIPETSQITDYLDSTARYELKHIDNPSYGSVGGEWAVIGLARYGTITDTYISIYKSNLVKKLKECNGNLSERKYTEYARVVMALTAIGENPESFAGYNMLKPLAELDKVVSQGANGIIYTLIALDCGSYNISKPAEDYKGERTTREGLIDMILDNQLEDGGWSLIGKKSDSDITAITLQALEPYYNKASRVTKAVDKGLDRLGELQQKEGDYKSGEFKTCETTAQVLTTLSVMNVDIRDERFVKNGNTVLDGLMRYYKGGAFSHFAEGDINQMATEQAMYAMTAYYRSISGMNGLLDMGDGIISRELKSDTNNKEIKDQQNNTVSKKKNNILGNETSKKKIIDKKIKVNQRKAKEKTEDIPENVQQINLKKKLKRKNKTDRTNKTIDEATLSDEKTVKETDSSNENKNNESLAEKRKNYLPAAVIMILAGIIIVIYAVFRGRVSERKIKNRYGKKQNEKDN